MTAGGHRDALDPPRPLPFRPFHGGDAGLRLERLPRALRASRSAARALAEAAAARAGGEPRCAYHRAFLARAGGGVDGGRLGRRGRSGHDRRRPKLATPTAVSTRRLAECIRLVGSLSKRPCSICVTTAVQKSNRLRERARRAFSCSSRAILHAVASPCRSQQRDKARPAAIDRGYRAGAGTPSAVAMSPTVAFSASLTCVPPKPRKPPSGAASATAFAMPASQVL